MGLLSEFSLLALALAFPALPSLVAEVWCCHLGRHMVERTVSILPPSDGGILVINPRGGPGRPGVGVPFFSP